MPLEVRQIGIRLRVAEPGEAAGEASVAPSPRVQRLQAERDRARLIEDCTQAVLAALARAADY